MYADTSRHRWTQAEDIVAFYLSRFGDRKLQSRGVSIAATLGLKESSLAMRISNFRYIDKGSGLRHAALQSRQILESYRTVSEPSLRRTVEEILNALSN